MSAKDPGTQRTDHTDDSVRETLAWIAGTEALTLQMKDAPPNPKLEWVLGLLEVTVARKQRTLRGSASSSSSGIPGRGRPATRLARARKARGRRNRSPVAAQ